MDLDRLDTPAASPAGPAGTDPAADGTDGTAPTTRVRPARRRPHRSLFVLGTAILVALTVGTSVALASTPAASAVPTPSTTPPAPAAVDAAFKQYAACMRDHGVDLPDPVTISSSATVPATLGSTGLTSGGAGLHVVVGTATAIQPGTAGTVPAPLAVSSDAFVAADKACSPILEAAGIKTTTSAVTAAGPVDVTGATGSASTLVSGGSIGAGSVGVAMAGSGDVTAMAADLKAYATCMRTHGVDMPDPVVDSKAGTVQLQSDADPSTAAFQAANTACSSGSFGFPAPPAPAATAAP
jgi:hypothetical protein